MIAYLPARPLRLSPTLPLLVLMVLLASLVGWLSHRSSHEAILRLNDRLVQAEAARVHETVQAALHEWPLRLAQAVHAVDQGAVRDAAEIERRLWPLAASLPLDDAELHLALADGALVSLRRAGGAAVILTLQQGDGPAAQVQRFRIRHAGDRQAPVLPTPATPLALTQVPWYAAALSGAGDRWTAVYTGDAGAAPRLALARALRSGDGRLLAVAAVSQPLQGLQALLNRADLLGWGLAYLVTPDGRPVASSWPTQLREPVASATDGPVSLIPTAHARDAGYVRPGDAADWMARSFRALAGGMRNPGEAAATAAFDNQDGERVMATGRSLRSGLGLDWWLVVAGTEARLSPGMHAASHASGVLAGGLTLVILLAGLALLRLSAHEVGRFTNAAERLSTDAQPERLNPPRLPELGRLGQAFNRMAERLASSADVVRKQNESLLLTVARLGEQIKARDAAEARLRQVTDSINEGLVVVGQDWRVTFANNLAHRYSAVSIDVALGRSLWEAMPALLGTAIERALREAMQQGTPRSVEVASIFPGHWLELRMFPFEQGLAVFFSDSTERRRIRLALAERQEQLRYLAGALLQSQSAERRAIARELHDELGQQLAAVRINLQVMIDQAQRQGGDAAAPTLARLADSLATVQQLIAQVRSRALDLHPAVLDDLGLAAALQWLCERQQQRLGVTVQLQGEDTIGALPPLVELACFRIAQEAIHNAVRHSGTDRVGLRLWLDDEGLHLVVSDNGHGFDAEDMLNLRRGHSLGLVSMRERAEQLGGRFEIRSRPGEGTHIEVLLPLQPHDDQDHRPPGR